MKHLDIHITAAGDSFRIKASRVITLEAYTTDDLQDVAADMAPGLAVLIRKVVAELAAQEGAADGKAE
jgi:hypothetical protein